MTDDPDDPNDELRLNETNDDDAFVIEDGEGAESLVDLPSSGTDGGDQLEGQAERDRDDEPDLSDSNTDPDSVLETEWVIDSGMEGDADDAGSMGPADSLLGLDTDEQADGGGDLEVFAIDDADLDELEDAAAVTATDFLGLADDLDSIVDLSPDGESELIGEEAEDDPIYGLPTEESEVEPSPEPADAGSGHEEVVLDGDGGAAEPVASGRRWRSLIGSLAAAALIASLGVGFLLTQPEWFGTRAAPVLVDRIDVARPVVPLKPEAPDASLPAPVIAAAPEPEVVPVADTVVSPVVSPVAVPVVEPAPTVRGQQQPIPPVLEEPVPTTGSSNSADVAPLESAGLPEVKQAAVVIGEELQIGERVGVAREGGRGRALGARLVAGDQAFAHLVNGNFFLGQVKAFGADHVTLRVQRGEVTFHFESLEALGRVDSEDYAELMRTTPSLVRLANQNQLTGSIVSGPDGRVSLQVETSRIVIPSAEINNVIDAVPNDVRVDGAEDGGWIEQLIEQKLEKKRQAPRRSGRPIGPSPK